MKEGEGRRQLASESVAVRLEHFIPSGLKQKANLVLDLCTVHFLATLHALPSAGKLLK